MHTFFTRRAVSAILIPLALMAAACTPAAVGSASPSTAPTAVTTPSIVPSAAPVATPTSPAPSVAPSSSGAGRQVTLTGSTGSTVRLTIVDESGTLAEATAGPVSDGASVPPYQLAITNVDPSTLRLVWAGGPCDLADTLLIDATARTFVLAEPECPGDSIAFDRTLILRFEQPIKASDVKGSVQDGLDTPA